MSNGDIYTGYTNDLEKRLKQHKKGEVFTTRKYLPIRLIYYEAFISVEDARERERKLKRFGSSWTNLRKRIPGSLGGFQEGG
jgi:putative endonuclease